VTRTADVVIVGGGLIGCSLAAELASREQSVVVVERAEPGGEASGAAAGMLSPQADAAEPSPFFDLALESRDLYPDWSRQVLEETGVDIGYRRTGLLRILPPGPAEEQLAAVLVVRVLDPDDRLAHVRELEEELGLDLRKVAVGYLVAARPLVVLEDEELILIAELGREKGVDEGDVVVEAAHLEDLLLA